MQKKLLKLSYEIELQKGEKLALPDSLTNDIGEGRWIVTIQPFDQEPSPIRNHSAFLNSYAPEDEGLYDDYPTR